MASNYRIGGTDTDRVWVRKDIFNKGGLWTWGKNDTGQLGDNTIVYRSSPVQCVSRSETWAQISASKGSNPHGIKTDGTLWSWGYNGAGMLGDNTTINRSSPVQTVAGGNDWKLVACGNGFVAAIKTDGTLWSWGDGADGRLGNNTTVAKSSPVQTISGGTDWKLVACGYTHAAAIKTDGSLWLWGTGDRGTLGNNNITNRSSPVQTIAGGTNWKQVACGAYFTTAIKTDGTLWSWGYNGAGMLGDNTTTNRSSPVQTIAGGNDWKFVTCGYYHTAAIKTDGTLWSWGINNYGQFGDNTTSNKSSPVQTISGGTDWKQIAGGGDYIAAIKTDGTLWSWGRNDTGQLGDNTTTHRYSPVQTISGGTNWKQVSCSFWHTAAIKYS